MMKGEALLWFRSAVVSALVYGVWAAYLALRGGSFDVSVANRAIAGAAFILIGCSFALSSVCHFWNFADRCISYRKHIGLLGFAGALTHSVVSLFFIPERFPFPQYYLAPANIAPFVFALIGLSILTMMAVISNRLAIKILGGQRWRLLLRVGYIAYAASLLHFVLKGYPYWLSWMITHRGPFLPPPGLILTLFGLWVLIMRVLLYREERKKMRISPSLDRQSEGGI